MNFLKTFPVTILFLNIFFNSAFSQSPDINPFILKQNKETILISSGAVLGLSSVVIMEKDQPLSEMEINSLNAQDVNGFDRIAIGPYQKDFWGDLFLYSSFLFPMSFVVYDDARKDFGTISVMYGEAALLTGSLTALVKGITKRNRPYVYDPDSPAKDRYDLSGRYSFFSGHTSMVAMNTFFTAQVYSGYLNDETAETLIWCAAAIIPAVTGYFRVETHNHFPSDVIVGYIVGAAIGYLIPEIHKSDENGQGSSTATPEVFIHRPVFGFQMNF